MSSVSIKLRSGKDNSQKIYLHINYGRKKQFRYSTGLSIQKLSHWDDSNKVVKNVKAEPHSHIINTELSKLYSFSTELLYELEKEGISIDNRLIKLRIEKFRTKGKPKKQKCYFTTYYAWFIDYYTTKPRPSTQKPLAKSTLRPYKNTLRILNEFEKYIKIKLTFENINLSFHSEFIEYLQKQELTANYIGTQIKNIKTVMNDAYERGHHNSTDYQKSGFTKPREDVNHIYLNEDEIIKIKELDYSEKPHLDISRDLFVIAAVTGLRVSDYKSLTKTNIKEFDTRKYLEITTQKTGRQVKIPLHPHVKDILEKRGGDFPKMIPEQKINDALKIIGKDAELFNETTIVRTVGGKLSKHNFKKYELLTNHTARRSFCTNAYKANMPVIDIMAISGHTSEKVFYNYIKASPMERLEKISQHPYFN